MYVRIEKLPFCDVKMSFSRTDEFEDDYLKYSNSECIAMEIYYVPPQTIYVSGASFTKHNKFHIVEYELKRKWTLIDPDSCIYDCEEEYTDSGFIKNPSYHFEIYGHFSGFSLEDSSGKTIYETGV